MMQIDMKYPETCSECKLCDESREYPYCWGLRQDRGYPFDTTKKKFPNCPLKPAEDKTKEQAEIAKLKDICRVMFNRCRATGSCGGAMCIFCAEEKHCEEMHSV